MVLLTSLPTFIIAETFFAIVYFAIIQFFTGLFWVVAILDAQNLSTNMQIFSVQNIIIFLLAVATMSVVMCLEIMTIIAITTYDYYRNDHIPFRKLLVFSYKKIKNFLRLRSFPFFLFIFLFPKAQIAPQTIFALNIPDFITAELVKFPLYSAIIFILIFVGIYFVYRSIFVLHYLFLERATIVRAFKSSFSLTKFIGFRKMMGIFFKNIFWIILFIIPIIAIGIVFARAITLLEPIVGNGIWNISDAMNAIVEFLFIGLVGAIFLAGLTIAYIRYSGYQKTHFENRFHFLKNTQSEPRWKNLRIFFYKKYHILAGGILIIFMPIFLLLIINTDSVMVTKNPIVISHRWESKNGYIENTVKGILQAKNLGANIVEIDVRENASGTLVVLHDTNLKRVANVDKEIFDITDDELEKITLPNGEKIPTLNEVLRVANMHNITLLIEPKPHGKEKDMVASLLDVLNKNAMIDKTLIHSFDLELLQKIKKLEPKLQTGLLIFGGFWQLWATDMDFFSLQERIVSRSYINNIKKYGKKVFVWTVNSELPIENYMRLGVDGIITDDINMIRARIDAIFERYQKWPQMIFHIFRMEFSQDDIISWFRQVFWFSQ